VQEIDWEHAGASLGVWIAPQVRGRGLARRALGLAARWLFEPCRLRRIELLTDPGNEAMLRAARAAGFLDDSVPRSYGRDASKRRDMAVLSLLRSDLERSGVPTQTEGTPGLRA
jgi:RimJ/RimL family protein N-acetyltransferase